MVDGCSLLWFYFWGIRRAKVHWWQLQPRLLYQLQCKVQLGVVAMVVVDFHWCFWGIRRDKVLWWHLQPQLRLSLAQLWYKVQLGVVAVMVGVYFLWFYFVCSYYVAPGGNFKAKAWERICRRQWLLLDIISTRMHKLFVSTAWIAPIGGTIIQVKIHSLTTSSSCM